MNSQSSQHNFCNNSIYHCAELEHCLLSKLCFLALKCGNNCRLWLDNDQPAAILGPRSSSNCQASARGQEVHRKLKLLLVQMWRQWGNDIHLSLRMVQRKLPKVALRATKAISCDDKRGRLRLWQAVRGRSIKS